MFVKKMTFGRKIENDDIFLRESFWVHKKINDSASYFLLVSCSFVLRASKSCPLNSNENFSLFVLLFVILLSVEQNWACKVRYFIKFTFEPFLRGCVLSYSQLFLLLVVKTEYLRAGLTNLFSYLLFFFFFWEKKY